MNERPDFTETEELSAGEASPAFEPRVLNMLLQNLLALDPREMGFSPSVAKVMRDAHVCTVGELIKQPEPVLLRWRGLGPSRLNEIKLRLQFIGLTLGVEPEGEDLRPVMESITLSLAEKRRSQAHHNRLDTLTTFVGNIEEIAERRWKAS